jgi:hypothetical protein
MNGTETRELRTSLEKWARSYEPRLLDGPGAQRQLRDVTRMKAICASVEAGLVRRIEETKVWQHGGHKSPAHAIATTMGTSLGEASRVLTTAQRLQELPDTAEAFRSGRVTQAQVHEIASAATEVPEAEQELIATAKDRNHAQLREHAARVRAAGRDVGERERRARAERGVCDYVDAEGVWHLHAHGAPSDAAGFKAQLKAETDIVFAEARKAGVRESHDAYRFDALMRIGETRHDDGERTLATGHVYVNVDADKLIGDTERTGAVCEIKGIGPVPVETARAYLGDCILTVLVKKGVDVTTIAHDGTKAMPVAVRRAVLARDQVCVVETCSAPTSQIHHLDWRSHGGAHSVDNCRGVCDWCHRLIHYEGYELEPNGDGTYRLRAPP